MEISLEGSACPRKILVSSIKSVQPFIVSPSYCLEQFLSPQCCVKSNVESPDNFLLDASFSPWSPLYLDRETHRQAAADILRVSCTKLFGEQLSRHKALLEKSTKQSHSVGGAVRDLGKVGRLIAEKRSVSSKNVRFLDSPSGGTENVPSTEEEIVLDSSDSKKNSKKSSTATVASRRLVDVGFLAADNRVSCSP